MNCSHCNAVNEADNVFCVNCGNPVAGGPPSSMPVTHTENRASQEARGYSLQDSTETAVVDVGARPTQVPQFAPGPYGSGQQTAPRRTNPLVWVAVALLALIVLIAGGLLLFLTQIGGSSEILPDHLGMFVQSKAKDRVDEIRKQDLTSVLEAKTTFSKSDTLPVVDAQPNLILYADGNDIPINDVRLIQIDTIKDDGSFKKLEIQAAPIDSKPAMKRIRVAQDLANGKYAFAVFGEYFNEGKHKFWPFQVTNSSRSDNGDALVAMTLPLKPAPPKQPAGNIPPTARPATIPPSMPQMPPLTGGNYARSNTANLILRSGPSQASSKIRKLGRGETVEVLGYSDNYEWFKGINGRFVQIRTMNGQVGWAFEPYLSR